MMMIFIWFILRISVFWWWLHYWQKVIITKITSQKNWLTTVKVWWMILNCLENPVIWINLQKHSHFPKLSILSHQILLKIIMIIAAVNSFSTLVFKAMHEQLMTRELINEYCPQLICATVDFFFGQKGNECT